MAAAVTLSQCCKSARAFSARIMGMGEESGVLLRTGHPSCWAIALVACL